MIIMTFLFLNLKCTAISSWFVLLLGALYQDGTSGADKKDDGVPSMGNHTYKWKVPYRAGPNRGDSGCVSWQYHSHIDSPSGTNTGLVGPMVICRQGMPLHYSLKRSKKSKCHSTKFRS